MFFRIFQVVKCITDQGSQIDIGTERFYENGVEFSCIVDQEEIEGFPCMFGIQFYSLGSGEESEPPQLNTSKCEELQDGEDLIVGNLVICCISRKFKGLRTFFL